MDEGVFFVGWDITRPFVKVEQDMFSCCTELPEINFQIIEALVIVYFPDLKHEIF